MSVELKDFRGKITTETDCVLEALSRVTGEDRSSIARDVLHRWALEQLRIHTVLERLLRAEGVAAASEGAVGEDEGARGSGGR